MTATRVCPVIREGDLLRRSLRDEETFFRVEEKNGKGAMQNAIVDVLDEVTLLFGGVTHERVVAIDEYAFVVELGQLRWIVIF
jgi:hypothetical protein